MRITLGNTDGKAYGLNANEACVLAVIEKCSKGDNAKGWYGSMQTLADVLPMKIDRTTVSRAVAKLLSLELIKSEDGKLFTSVQIAQNSVQNAQESVQIAQKTVQNAPPSYSPIYKEKENNEGSNARTITRDAWVALKKEFSIFWARAKPAVKFSNRYKSCEALWASKDEVSRGQLLEAVASDALGEDENPWKYIANFKPREPTDWNGKVADEPTEIAFYKGRAGMYTLKDIQMFHLKTKSKQ